MTQPVTALVLAAGKGTRMQTARAKVLHPLAGRTMIAHVLAVVAELAPTRAVVVLAPGMDDVAAEVARAPLATVVAVQEPQRGTGHAVLAARAELPAAGDVLVVYGDTPLITAATLERLLAARRAAGAAIAVLGMRPPDSAGYGRLAVDADGLQAIVEDRHAGPELKQSAACNAGIMALDATRLGALLDALAPTPPKGEYYLTDLVGHARRRGWPCVAMEGPWLEGLGINSQAQLAEAEGLIQTRLRARAMAGGVSLRAPETVFLSADTELSPGVEIEPHVVLGPGVRIAEGAQVLSFCHLEGVRIERGARIGPFARIRPETVIGDHARVGNFVEIKNATLASSAKANHLAYVGDASVGAGANIGAGTITCNYDGVLKHQTTIGAGAFIGSNSALVAPVTIGDGAIVGAGSIINQGEDVAADALTVVRGERRDLAAGGTRFRARKRVEKAARQAARQAEQQAEQQASERAGQAAGAPAETPAPKRAQG